MNPMNNSESMGLHAPKSQFDNEKDWSNKKKPQTLIQHRLQQHILNMKGMVSWSPIVGDVICQIDGCTNRAYSHCDNIITKYKRYELF